MRLDSLNILIVTPAPAGATTGNRVTAMRWAKLLREMGHKVTIATSFDGKPRDLLLALHAIKSGDAIRAFRGAFLGRPIGVLVTGTDLYVDAPAGAPFLGILEIANAVAVLQPKAIDDLPAHLRQKARVIYQSVEPPKSRATARQRALWSTFDVAVLAHLRSVKDPLRTAKAARLLPMASKIHVSNAGTVLEPEFAAQVEAEARENPRFSWLGEISHSRAQALIARSKLVVVSSRSEGGANVIGEAIVAGTPVLASKVAGNIGLLGEKYPGYFPCGDEQALAKLMLRCEKDAKFYARLKAQCEKLRPQFDPRREQQSLAQFVADLVPKMLA